MSRRRKASEERVRFDEIRCGDRNTTVEGKECVGEDFDKKGLEAKFRKVGKGKQKVARRDFQNHHAVEGSKESTPRCYRPSTTNFAGRG